MKGNSRIYLIVFSASVCSLAFEITLTRIFSISLWYHFAFMAISIAMLGLGLSGTVLSLFPRASQISRIDIYLILQGISMVFGYLLTNQIPFDPVRFQWAKIQFLYIGCYYLILLLPFFFTGLIIATAFQSLSNKSGTLYAADLLGAGIGSVGILFLLHHLSPEHSLFLLTLSIFLLSIWLGRKKQKVIAAAGILFLATLIFLAPDFMKIRISPYKELSLALRYPGALHLNTFHNAFSRVDIFKSPAIRYAPGLSLKYQQALPEQIGCSTDGDQLVALTGIQDKSRFDFLSFLPSALVYEIGHPGDVLIIDPRGGLPVLMARHYHANHIQKVESNSLLVELMQNHYNDYSGHIYAQNTSKGLGRTWLKSHSCKYDIIDISLMSSIPSGVAGLSEDYRFTVEAFREYWSHLKKDGFLSLSLYILPPPRHALRLLTTLVEALRDSGINRPDQHLIAIRSWGSISLVIKRSPLKSGDIAQARDFAGHQMFDMIAYPGITSSDSNVFIKSAENFFFNAFSQIMDSSKRDNFIETYIFDISPVYDDQPFFHYFLKFKNIKDIYRVTGQKWDFFIREGYLLPIILIQVVLLSLILIALPALIRTRKTLKSGPQKNKMPILIYFSLLGMGFMFVEIVLIQKLMLLLTDPLMAISAGLTSVLIGAGIGGFLSSTFKHLQKPYSILVLPPLIILYVYLLPIISKTFVHWPLALKFPLIALIILPIGIFLGIPFPSGMKILGKTQQNLIPWAWTVNSCLAVATPILTILIGLSYGFNSILWIGAVIYLLAFISIFIYQKRMKIPAR